MLNCVAYVNYVIVGIVDIHKIGYFKKKIVVRICSNEGAHFPPIELLFRPVVDRHGP